jgi:hypothetical protein
MGIPTSEVGYTPAMPRREDHEVDKGHVVALGGGYFGFNSFPVFLYVVWYYVKIFFILMFYSSFIY